jgi:predicted RNA-binding protein with PIN domain
VPAPSAIRVLLSHRRLSATALATIRKVVDEDSGFRQRVALAAEEAALGRPAWLWVTRPEGWEDELAALAVGGGTDDSDGPADGTGDRAARVATKKAQAAEQARHQALAERDEARARAAAATEQLSLVRATLAIAEEEVERLTQRVAALGKERDSAHRRAAEVDQLRRRVAELEEEAITAQRAAERTADREAAAASAAFAAAVAIPVQPGARTESPAAPAPRPPPDVDVAAVASAVTAAGEAAEILGRALGRAAAALGGDPAGHPGPNAGPSIGDRWAGPGRPGDRRVASPPLAGPSRRRGPKRTPAPLPPAVLDDSREAAEHLVRLPGALLVVDGYNASLAYRPDVALPAQRSRLADALAELSARTGIDVHVVFDGAEAAWASEGGGRRGVRVSFTAADVEADDAILELVDAEPVTRPVVVASSDRRVQLGASKRGANPISTDQLLAALRRER